MWRLQVWLLLCTILYKCNHLNGQTLPYHCAVDGACNSIPGACDSSTGDCTAGTCSAHTTPSYNYDCLSAQATTGTTNCPNNCDQTHTYGCAGDTAAQCECNEGYVNGDGDTVGCEQNRLGIVCTPTGVTFEVYPYSAVASIHFLDHTNTDAHTTCALTLTNSAFYSYHGTGSTSIELPYAAGSAPCNFGADNTAGTTYIFKMYIQKNADYRYSYDKQVTITCTKLADGSIVPHPTISIGSAAPTAIAASISASVDLGTTITLEKASAPGTALASTDTIAAGEKLKFILVTPDFDATNEEPYSGMSIQKIVLANYNLDTTKYTPGTDTTNEQSLTILEHFCVQQNPSVFISELKKTTETTNLQLVAVTAVPYFTKTVGSNTAGQTFASIDVCIKVGTTGATCAVPGANPCNFPYADPIFDPLAAPVAGTGRRKRHIEDRQKRDAENEIPHNFTAVMTFTVTDPRAPSIIVQTGDQTKEAENCHQTLMFILPLALMGTILILSLVLLSYFYIKLRTTMGEQKHGSTNLAYKS